MPNENLEKLVQYARNKKPVAFKELLHSEIGSRMSTKISDIKTNLSKTMFQTGKEEVELDEKLKYEGKFKKGDTIKSFDFPPRGDRKTEHYISGKITGTEMRRGAKVYVIKVTNDSGKTSGGRVGDTGYVPMETSMDWNDRIVKEEVELDEGKMKDLSMRIDNIVANLKKNRKTKGFADKFKKDVTKTMDIEKSLENVLPGYKKGDKRYSTAGIQELDVEEGYSSSQVKKAIKIAHDMGGNMTGAVKKIERIKRGLSDDEAVEDALKSANEAFIPKGMKIPEGSKEEYQKFFNSKLAKYKVKSPAELDDAQKKKFFNEIEKEWKSEDE